MHFLTFLASEVAQDQSLWDKMEEFFTSVADFFEGVGSAIVSAIEFLIDTVQSIVDAVELIADYVDQLTGLSNTLPIAISSVFVLMLSLCIAFFIAGR